MKLPDLSGHFEVERIRSLAQEGDRSWLAEARGKVPEPVSSISPPLAGTRDPPLRIRRAAARRPEIAAACRSVLT